MKQENSSKNISFIGEGFRMTLPKCDSCKWFDEEKFTCNAFTEHITIEKLWGMKNVMGNINTRKDNLPPVVMAGGIFVPFLRR